MTPQTPTPGKIELDLVGCEERSFATLQEVACLRMEGLGFVNSQIQRMPGKTARIFYEGSGSAFNQPNGVLGVWAFGTQILVQTREGFYLE